MITAQTRDAIATFLDTDYLTAKIRQLTAAAGAEIADPDKTIQASPASCASPTSSSARSCATSSAAAT
ncbi:hypothetical protein [Microbispora sp. NPDC049633]|uniref:hypothetical protein n=1 Tax=Microbispora sp. NPDC049633 TaxID=3154355 RepID=UPI00342AF881